MFLRIANSVLLSEPTTAFHTGNGIEELILQTCTTGTTPTKRKMDTAAYPFRVECGVLHARLTEADVPGAEVDDHIRVAEAIRVPDGELLGLQNRDFHVLYNHDG